MTFNVMVPVTIADANFDASNVPENDYTEWNSATAYVVGDRAIITGTTHKIYECLIAHTNQTPLTAANLYPAVGAEWITVGATNRWRPFDKILSSLTTKSGDIAYRLLMTQAVTTLALFGVTGGTVQCIVYDTSVARRNLLTYSEEFDNGVYAYTRSSTGTQNIYQDPWGAYQADAFFEDSTAASTHFMTVGSVNFTAASVYTFSIYVKRRAWLGSRDVRLLLPAAAFSAVPLAVFDLTTGTVSSTGGGASAAISALDAYGYYRVSITATADITAAGLGQIYLVNGGLTTYDGNGVAGLQISSVQIEVGALTAYQWIRAAAVFGDLSFNSTQNKSVYLGGNSSEAVFRNIGADSGDYVAVAVYASGGTAQVGEIAMGISYPIGNSTGLSPGITDYSSKTLDPFGNATIIARNFAKRADYTLEVNKTDTAQIVNFLAALRSVPVVWYDTDDTGGDWGSMVYGFWNEFSTPLTGATKAFMSLRIEGIV